MVKIFKGNLMGKLMTILDGDFFGVETEKLVGLFGQGLEDGGVVVGETVGEWVWGVRDC